MLYLFVALFFFFDAVVIHLLVCRRAGKEGLLLKIFFVIAAGNLALCGLAFGILMKFSQGATGIWFAPFILSSVVIYILLIPAYLVFYFSTQQVSPSKKIMLLLAERPMSLNDLRNHFRDEDLIAPRIDDLIVTRCIAVDNGRYSLTTAGENMGRIYTLYQAVLGRKKGG